jgi:hypothetical protein
MLALLVFPLVDKTMHDFGHFNDDRCGIKDTHFCQAEHTCSICDYVYSSSATPPITQEHLTVFSKPCDRYYSLCVFNTSVPPKFNLSLRGPPATV